MTLLRRITQPRWLFGIILVVGFAVRIPSLWYGVPHLSFVDEYIHTAHALKIISEANPFLAFSYLPPLIPYLMLPFIALWGLVGIAFGLFSGVAGFQEFAILQSGYFVLITRAISIAFGMGILATVYAFARRMFGNSAALLAASLASFDMLLTIEAQAGRIWGAITFFIVFGMYGLYRLHETNQTRWCVCVAACIGLGWGVGYIPAILIPWALYAFWAAHKKYHTPRINRNALMAVLVIIICMVFFALANTYSMQRQFGRGFNTIANFTGIEIVIPEGTGEGFDNTPKLLENYQLIGSILAHDMLYVALLALGVFVILCAYLCLRKSEFVFVGLFPFIYLLGVPFVFGGLNVNYILPAIPFLIMLGSWGVVRVVNMFSNRTMRSAALFVILGVLFVPRMHHSIVHASLLLRDDTRTQAVKWIEREVPDGSVLVSDIPDIDQWLLPSDQGVLYKTEAVPGRVRTRDIYIREHSASIIKPRYTVIATQYDSDWRDSALLNTAAYLVVGTYMDGVDSKARTQELLNVFKGRTTLVQRLYPEGEHDGYRSVPQFFEDDLFFDVWNDRRERYGPYIDIYALNR